MKIPKQAKKVFTGEIFDVYQWPQKMYNGKTATFEMIDRADTVQIIATRGNKILMGIESQPNLKRGLTLFGGRIDKDETPLYAAKRELKEESGLASNDWDLFRRYQPITKIDWEIFYYVARDCKVTAKQSLDGGEKINVTELTFDEFVEYFTAEFRQHWLSYFLTKLKAEQMLGEFRKMLFGN